MRFIKKAEEPVWRLLEWSFVMGALSWLLVRMWNESLYDRNRRRSRRKWLDRLRSRRLIGTGAHPGAADAADPPEANPGA